LCSARLRRAKSSLTRPEGRIAAGGRSALRLLRSRFTATREVG